MISFLVWYTPPLSSQSSAVLHWWCFSISLQIYRSSGAGTSSATLHRHSTFPFLPPSLQPFLKVDWESLTEGTTASLFRGDGSKQSTLTQKPSVATLILIFVARHTYLYIGLH